MSQPSGASKPATIAAGLMSALLGLPGWRVPGRVDDVGPGADPPPSSCLLWLVGGLAFFVEAVFDPEAPDPVEVERVGAHHGLVDLMMAGGYGLVVLAPNWLLSTLC